MASNNDTSSTSDFEYFKTRLHGLQVVVGDPDPTKGQVAQKTLSFVPYFVYEKGKEGKQKYGYLATKNGSAIKKLSNDFNVERITKKEFEDATVESYDNGNPKEQISGFRAPY